MKQSAIQVQQAAIFDIVRAKGMQEEDCSVGGLSTRWNHGRSEKFFREKTSELGSFRIGNGHGLSAFLDIGGKLVMSILPDIQWNSPFEFQRKLVPAVRQLQSLHELIHIAIVR